MLRIPLLRAMAEAETAHVNSSDKNPITIRYRFGMAPDRKIESDPSLMETIRAMDRVDGAVFLSTFLVPSIYGYRIQSNSSSFYYSYN